MFHTLEAVERFLWNVHQMHVKGDFGTLLFWKKSQRKNENPISIGLRWAMQGEKSSSSASNGSWRLHMYTSSEKLEDDHESNTDAYNA